MENVPGVSFLFSYQTLIKYAWRLVQELRGRSASHFSMKPLSKVNGNTPGLPGPIPLRFFIKSLLKVNGNALGTCRANDLPASQPTNQSTSQPPAGLAGLGWAGWGGLARLANMC